MINTPATIIEFGYEDCGMSKPVVATCEMCGDDRITGKRNADGLCRACSARHQDHTYKRISVKSVGGIGASI